MMIFLWIGGGLLALVGVLAATLAGALRAIGVRPRRRPPVTADRDTWDFR
jgi:hypothetical protein